MAPISTMIEGALVAHSTYNYDFRDDAGKQVKGAKHRLFVCTAFDQAPTEVVVKDPALFGSILSQNGQGSPLRLECEVRAKATSGGGATNELVLVQAHGDKKAA